MTNKTCIFFLLFFVYIFADKHDEKIVVLWYPLPMKLNDYQSITRTTNCTRCKDFLIKYWYPNYTQPTNCHDHTEGKRTNVVADAPSDPVHLITLPTTAANDIISVRQGDDDPQESMESQKVPLDRSIESRIITLPQNQIIDGVTQSLLNPIDIIGRSGSISTELTKENPITSENAVHASDLKDDDIVINTIQLPTENYTETEEITSRINVTPTDSDYVTSSPNDQLGNIVKDYLDDSDSVYGKPCNCTTLLTRILNRYLYQMKLPQ